MTLPMPVNLSEMLAPVALFEVRLMFKSTATDPNETVFVPVPPVTVSVPIIGSMVSFPAPPFSTLLLPSPVMVSFP